MEVSFGICATGNLLFTLVNWMMSLDLSSRQELGQLRRQLRKVQQERDILSKATSWFANNDSAIDKNFKH